VTASDQTPKKLNCQLMYHHHHHHHRGFQLLAHKTPSCIISSRTLTQMHAFLHYDPGCSFNSNSGMCVLGKYSQTHQIIRLITPPNKVPIDMMSLLGKRPLKLQPRLIYIWLVLQSDISRACNGNGTGATTS
jgi:hypothetical protein